INEGDRFENNEEAIVDELTEEQFHSIENQISEIPENGWLDKYLGSIQEKLKGGAEPDEYKK
ncbi:hypothetical protein BD408DRAFT_326625, partial [Parasitella parasitica]